MLAIPDEALLCDDLKTTPNSQSRHLEAVHRLSCAPRLGSGAIYSMKSNAIQTIPCIPEQDPTLCSSKSMKNPPTLSPLLAGWTPVLTGNARLFYHVQCYCHPFPTARHERSLSVARRQGSATARPHFRAHSIFLLASIGNPYMPYAQT
jgi:hypothetical protein